MFIDAAKYALVRWSRTQQACCAPTSCQNYVLIVWLPNECGEGTGGEIRSGLRTHAAN